MSLKQHFKINWFKFQMIQKTKLRYTKDKRNKKNSKLPKTNLDTQFLI